MLGLLSARFVALCMIVFSGLSAATLVHFLSHLDAPDLTPSAPDHAHDKVAA
jgi:hypothetical protein